MHVPEIYLKNTLTPYTAPGKISWALPLAYSGMHKHILFDHVDHILFEFDHVRDSCGVRAPIVSTPNFGQVIKLYKRWHESKCCSSKTKNQI